MRPRLGVSGGRVLRGVGGWDGFTEGVRDGGRELSIAGIVSVGGVRTGKYS